MASKEITAEVMFEIGERLEKSRNPLEIVEAGGKIKNLLVIGGQKVADVSAGEFSAYQEALVLSERFGGKIATALVLTEETPEKLPISGLATRAGLLKQANEFFDTPPQAVEEKLMSLASTKIEFWNWKVLLGDVIQAKGDSEIICNDETFPKGFRAVIGEKFATAGQNEAARIIKEAPEEIEGYELNEAIGRETNPRAQVLKILGAEAEYKRYIELVIKAITQGDILQLIRKNPEGVSYRDGIWRLLHFLGNDETIREGITEIGFTSGDWGMLFAASIFDPQAKPLAKAAITLDYFDQEEYEKIVRLGLEVSNTGESQRIPFQEYEVTLYPEECVYSEGLPIFIETLDAVGISHNDKSVQGLVLKWIKQIGELDFNEETQKLLAEGLKAAAIKAGILEKEIEE